jgi:2-polyprenyl-6-methoxyphenol hydroxylase-like FAD-dependent oxidoreductase
VRVIVAGAGIGGLSAALSLHAAGALLNWVAEVIGANGGSQAVVDARVLAWSLAQAGTPAEGLAAYEAARQETAWSLFTSGASWHRSG